MPTLDGPVTLTVPPKSSGGGALRLKGKGLPRASGSAATSWSRSRIVLPEGGDADLEALARKWQAEKRHGVRDEDAEA